MFVGCNTGMLFTVLCSGSLFLTKYYFDGIFIYYLVVTQILPLMIMVMVAVIMTMIMIGNMVE